VEETLEFVAEPCRRDRISVVQATYETALLMAEGAGSRHRTKPRSCGESSSGGRCVAWPPHLARR